MFKEGGTGGAAAVEATALGDAEADGSSRRAAMRRGVGPFCCYQYGADIRRELTVSKWAYCILFTIVQVVTWLLRSYGDTTFKQQNLFAHVCAAQGAGSVVGASALCTGQQVVLRFSFATFSFFALHAIALFWCTREGDVRLGLHTSLWFWKCLLWAGGLVGFLFVPAEAIFYYGSVARFGAGVFLVFVMVEMVTWTYDVNEALVARDNWWAWSLLVGGAALSFAGGLAALGAAYHFYATSSGCSLNLFFISWSLVVGLGLVGVLFVPRRLEVAGLLTSGVVFMYCSYLLLSALSSQPPNACIRDSGMRVQWITVRAGGVRGDLSACTRGGGGGGGPGGAACAAGSGECLHTPPPCLHARTATRHPSAPRPTTTTTTHTHTYTHTHTHTPHATTPTTDRGLLPGHWRRVLQHAHARHVTHLWRRRRGPRRAAVPARHLPRHLCPCIHVHGHAADRLGAVRQLGGHVAHRQGLDQHVGQDGQQVVL
jgi:hypothetical protein